ncbi:putative protein kinase RLK-Pelle-LRR-XII-1 family [Medicago truncatula]|uniref:non-specific serine/threonine protein kinase n=1 Tax=Medicago truncatula TaxID=3880 RepID=A0A396HTD1_MEDTR|nr:putative protein kinase RLK-Pelle-LRR-XII-1 family [Medicago truncatula]
MKPFSFLSPILLFVYLHFLFCPNRVVAQALGNQTDHFALIKFKETIYRDPNGALESWNSSIHFCKWHGITCSLMHQRVTKLNLEGYQLHGSISPYVGNLTFLTEFNLMNNSFYGEIPQELGRLLQLEQLLLSNNSLAGEIPTNLTHCSNLKDLYLGGNNLIGKIPNEIGSLKKLQSLAIWKNKLTGGIPSFIGNLSSLTDFSFVYNNLELRRRYSTRNMTNPHFHNKCVSFEYLLLQGNSFNGTIPSSLASLKGLLYLDLSRNQFYGSIPNVIQNIFGLKHLNVSFNLLEGEVPTNGVFGNATHVAMIGNNKLCGGISDLHLPSCPIKGRKHATNHNFRLVSVIVSVVSFLIILSFIIIITWMKKRNQKPSFDSPTIDQLDKVSYQDLHQGTDGFSDKNLIGSGGFGSVYRGNLVSEGNVVAVKVFNLQNNGASKSFIVECNALKNIRHRNLVKVLTCCSSTDYKGEEFKALVFDYMKNGSLEQWLHPEILNSEHPKTLDLGDRLNIIIDVASALHYLHQECEQLIIHCDLKPSNVLLNDDMVAHVSDFGIAKLVSATDGNTSTIGIKGTIGYAPPEYGMGSEVSTCGDMYSFGILMLEMLTGRRPTHEVFEDGQNLHNFVAISLPDT